MDSQGAYLGLININELSLPYTVTSQLRGYLYDIFLN